MSLFRSILPGRPLQRADYDLPLYRTYQEPEAFPPVGVSNSIYVPQKMAGSATQPQSPEPSSPRSQDLLALRRREKYYQQKLQELLDAQSDGLIAGLEGAETGTAAAADDEDSLDTPTQTTYSLRSHSGSPAPSRTRKKRTLGAARRGIWRTVLDCAAVKQEEDILLRQALKDDQAVLAQLESWSGKEQGLREKITTIESEDTGAKSQALKEEASRLESEIIDMEVRLGQMKTRHRQLVDEIKDVENSVRSKLSSYTTSLSMLEQDVQSFLKSPPVGSDRGNSDSPFLSLPAKRRTLDLAKEHWQTGVDDIKKQRKAIRRDRAALEDGAAVWKDVVAEVTDFERYLRNATAKLAQQQLPPASGKGKSPSIAATITPAEMLEKMDEVSRSVEEKLELAQNKQWRLLEVCVEAELQALQQGREMLENAFGLADDRSSDAGLLTEPDVAEKQPSTQSSSTRDLFASAAEGLGSPPNGALTHSAALRKSMYEHDEPDPELLFTRQADDTE